MGDVVAFVNLLILSERGTKEQSDKVRGSTFEVQMDDRGA